ncbi:MAG: helix-turn-helix domain-containing protein [Prevotella sp.]|nr:helix-turn-helix domain-containing protein [Prevotella sp.]
MEQNQELCHAWDFVEHTGRSIFLTGKAGTGKTTFLKTVVEQSSKRCIVVAPTGVAAINAGGMTIHSFFQLPFSPFVPGAKIESKFDFGKEKRKIISSLDLLIIDEISMVRSDLLDAIDSVLRRYRDRYKPFGGVQLMMIGDLQQLTPVVTPEDERMLSPYYDTPYFFGSKALAQIDYVTIQLEKVYRQQDDIFLTLLNHIREGHPTTEDLALLNSRYQPAFIPKPEEGYIRLTTHNQMANNYNETELQKLPGRAYTYQAKIDGTFPEYSYPTAETLTLKVGAQVMFVKNDPSGNHLYYNGRIGHVTYADSSRLQVYCPGDDEAIEVEPLEWENSRYTLNEETREIETEVLGKFSQLPLRLAWAITIHKSQGLTFERAIIDASLSFAPGQVYVALSRCKTLEGMVLASQIPSHAIISDTRVETYIAHQEEAAQRSIEQLPTLKDDYYRYLLLELFDFKDILYREEYLSRLITEFFYHSFTDIAELHKRTLEDYKQQVITVAEKWITIIQQMTIEALREEEFLERVKRSAAYFEQTLEKVLEKPLALVPSIQSNNKQAMKRLTENFVDLRQAWLSRRYLLQQMAEHTFTIADYLHQKQHSQLDAMDEQTLKKKKREKKAKEPKPQKEPKPKKEKTWVITYGLYQQGMTPELIARERGLTIGTIYGHLARYIPTGDISLDDLIPEDHQQAILQAIHMAGSDAGSTAIKTLCPPDITYDEIRLMRELRGDSLH